MPIVTHEILDPPGYAPERARSLEQSQLRSDKTHNSTTMQVKLVLPQSPSDTFNQSIADGSIGWTYTEHRQLLIVNGGSEGRGFSICRSCGAGAPDDPDWLHQNHDRPFLIPPWMNASKNAMHQQEYGTAILGMLFTVIYSSSASSGPQESLMSLGPPGCMTHSIHWRRLSC